VSVAGYRLKKQENLHCSDI